MAKQQQVNDRTTLIKFAVKTRKYVAGKGTSKPVYKVLKVRIGTDAAGKPITTDCFYCEWLSSYGSQAIALQQQNVMQPARVRLPFVQKVYDALLTDDVIIYLHGKTDAANCFMLNASPDNFLQKNKMLDFQVKRYEVRG